jgi:hypothetical protein
MRTCKFLLSWLYHHLNGRDIQFRIRELTIPPHWPLTRHFGLYNISMVHTTQPAPEADRTATQSIKRGHDPDGISKAGAADLVVSDGGTTASVAKMYSWLREYLDGEHIQVSLPGSRYYHVNLPTILWLLQYLDRKHMQVNIQKRWYHATNYRDAFETFTVFQWQREEVSIYVY